MPPLGAERRVVDLPARRRRTGVVQVVGAQDERPVAFVGVAHLAELHECRTCPARPRFVFDWAPACFLWHCVRAAAACKRKDAAFCLGRHAVVRAADYPRSLLRDSARPGLAARALARRRDSGVRPRASGARLAPASARGQQHCLRGRPEGHRHEPGRSRSRPRGSTVPGEPRAPPACWRCRPTGTAVVVARSTFGVSGGVGAPQVEAAPVRPRARRRRSGSARRDDAAALSSPGRMWGRPQLGVLTVGATATTRSPPNSR